MFLNLKKLKIVLHQLKLNNKKIGLCHGVFDILHIGHIKYFSEAKNNCDYLIVSVTSDKFVKKGSGRPFFKLNRRVEFLKSIKHIDEVIVSDNETSENIIKLIKPDVYFKGSEYKNLEEDITQNIKKEINLVKKYGGITKFTSGITYSSSKLINNISDSYNSEQKKFVKKIIKKNNLAKITNILNSFQDIKILIIGEIIIDKYTFCETIGKAGKEPHLVLRNKYSEKYLGGAGLVANNISSFCNKVDLLSLIDAERKNFQFINKKLKKNIKKIFFKNLDSPNITKERYIDEITGNKIIGNYILEKSEINKKLEKKIILKLKKNIKNYDLIVVADYNHGFVTKKIASFLSSNSKFLAINSQLNATNFGYHNFSKFHRSDLLIANENEIRHDVRDKIKKISEIVNKFKKIRKIKKILVTRGSSGCNYYEKNNKKEIHCPAFSKSVVDKVGSGDFLMSIAILCVYNKTDPQLTLLLSSIAASFAVEKMGNAESLSKQDMLKYLKHHLFF
jgi:rfaE bifunctional protein kinase chain/domain/rfaE bifunctional protein nucleotidyltransferase chain/domain